MRYNQTSRLNGEKKPNNFGLARFSFLKRILIPNVKNGFVKSIA